MKNVSRQLVLIIGLLALGLAFNPSTAQGDFVALLGSPINMHVYEVRTLEGETVNLPAVGDGKVYLVAFWHLDCVFCQAEGLLALQDEVYEVYNTEQLEIIAVNTDPASDIELLQRYRDEREIQYTFYTDGAEAADELGLIVPIMIVIDQDGKVVYLETDKTFNTAIATILEELGVEKVN